MDVTLKDNGQLIKKKKNLNAIWAVKLEWIKLDASFKFIGS